MEGNVFCEKKLPGKTNSRMRNERGKQWTFNRITNGNNLQEKEIKTYTSLEHCEMRALRQRM